MLFNKTPIGYIQVPEWEEKKLVNLSDDELLLKAYEENKKFVISPATFAMIEKRFLDRRLQQLINRNVGISHVTIDYLENLNHDHS